MRGVLSEVDGEWRWYGGMGSCTASDSLVVEVTLAVNDLIRISSAVDNSCVVGIKYVEEISLNVRGKLHSRRSSNPLGVGGTSNPGDFWIIHV